MIGSGADPDSMFEMAANDRHNEEIDEEEDNQVVDDLNVVNVFNEREE